MIMERSALIRIAILKTLNRMSSHMPMPEESLTSEVSLAISPRPGIVGIKAELINLKDLSYIADGENIVTGTRTWIITEAGRCALSQI